MALPAWVRLHFDRVRDRWVLLAPERVLFPCATSVTILERLARAAALGELVDGAGGRVRRAARRRSAPTCGRCCRASPTRASSPWRPAMADRSCPGRARALDRAADGPAGRAHPSLPAAVPLLLEPARAGAGHRRARAPPNGAACSTRPPSSACCSSTSRAASRRRARDLEADRRPRARAGPLHQPDHRRRAARRGADRACARPASSTCSSACRRPSPRRRPRRRLSRRAREEARRGPRRSAPPACR